MLFLFYSFAPFFRKFVKMLITPNLLLEIFGSLHNSNSNLPLNALKFIKKTRITDLKIIPNYEMPTFIPPSVKASFAFMLILREGGGCIITGGKVVASK